MASCNVTPDGVSDGGTSDEAGGRLYRTGARDIVPVEGTTAEGAGTAGGGGGCPPGGGGTG